MHYQTLSDWDQLGPKTRVLIYCSEESLASLTRSSLELAGKPMNFQGESGELEEVEESDFVLLQTSNADKAKEFTPNIVLLTNVADKSTYGEFLNTVKAGGIVLYPESDHGTTELLGGLPQYFRKIPYPLLDEASDTLSSDLGVIHMQFENGALRAHVEGIRLLLQHLGVMEEEFYESLSQFELSSP